MKGSNARRPLAAAARAHQGTAQDRAYHDPVPLYTARGQRCGTVVGRVAYIPRRRAKHFHRQRGGWYFDVCVLEAAARAGAERVVVVAVDTDERFEASLARLLDTGERWHDPQFGPQVGLRLADWREPAATQLNLFGFAERAR